MLAFLGTFFYASPRAKHNLLKLIPSELESEVTDLSQAEREGHILRREAGQNGCFSLFFFTYSGGIFSSFFRYPRPLGKRPPSVFSSRQDYTMTVREVRFFQLPIFPLPAGAVDRFTIRDKLIDELHLPKKTSRLPDARGFTVVEGWVPRDTNNYVYHVALKIHGHAERRPLQRLRRRARARARLRRLQRRSRAGLRRVSPSPGAAAVGPGPSRCSALRPITELLRWRR